jgi:hypothetical protein
MTTSTHIQLLADEFGLHGLESRIIHRLADQAQATIRIWPYAVSQNLFKMNESLGRPEFPRDYRRTHVLVLPSTIDVYDQARNVVFEKPILAFGEPRIRVLIEPLPLVDITALFLASRVEYCLALSLVLYET